MWIIDEDEMTLINITTGNIFYIYQRNPYVTACEIRFLVPTGGKPGFLIKTYIGNLALDEAKNDLLQRMKGMNKSYVQGE